MKKLGWTLILLTILISTNVWAETKKQNRPYLPANVTDLTVTGDALVGGDLTVGGTAADEVRPSIYIIGDADSDGTITSETLTVTLVGASDPLEAYWSFSSSQIAKVEGGYKFDNAISFTTNRTGVPVAGISRNATDGLVIGGSTGSASDVAITDSGGNFLWRLTSGAIINERDVIADTNGIGFLSRKNNATGNVFEINNTNDTLTMGHSSMDDIRPSILIMADADSDSGGDTDDTFKIILTPAVDPTDATWGFTCTQCAGYTFDNDISAASASNIGDGTNKTVISSTGDVTFGGSAGLTFGGIYTSDSAVAFEVDADLTHTKFTGFTVDQDSNGVTSSHSGDKLTIVTAGKYWVMVSVTVEDDGNANHEFHMEMHKNSGVNEGANSKFISNVCTTAGDDCPTDNIMYVTHAFVDGDIVYSTVTEMGMTTLVELEICEVDGTVSFGLGTTSEATAGDCDNGTSTQLDLTEELSPTGKLVIVGTSIMNVHAHGDFRTSTDKMSLPLGGIVNLAVGDTISIWMWTDDSTVREVTPSDISFSIMQIGG